MHRPTVDWTMPSSVAIVDCDAPSLCLRKMYASCCPRRFREADIFARDAADKRLPREARPIASLCAEVKVRPVDVFAILSRTSCGTTDPRSAAESRAHCSGVFLKPEFDLPPGAAFVRSHPLSLASRMYRISSASNSSRDHAESNISTTGLIPAARSTESQRATCTRFRRHDNDKCFDTLFATDCVVCPTYRSASVVGSYSPYTTPKGFIARSVSSSYAPWYAAW